MSYYPDGKRKHKRKGRNMRGFFTDDHHLGRRRTQPVFDPDEAHYWEAIRRYEELEGNFHSFNVFKGAGRLPRQETRPEIQGFTRKELVEYLRDLYPKPDKEKEKGNNPKQEEGNNPKQEESNKPKLRHKEEEILNFLEKKKILEPVDYISDVVLPEEATEILTSNIPKIIDDALSIEQISKWLMDDVKLVLNSLATCRSGDLERDETLDWAEYVMDTYRKGLKSLRRKVKAEKEERDLEKLVEYYKPLGLSISIDDLFGDDQALVNSLENAGIRYLFQLIHKSKSEINEINGIGATRMDRIENSLLSMDLKFLGKEPEKKKKKKKEDKTGIKAKIVNI